MSHTPTLGRPTAYTQELADRICEALAECGNLRQVCKADGMPAESTVRKWALEDRKVEGATAGFSAQYARAREIGYQSMADDLLDIADESGGDAITDPETGNTRMDAEFVARSRLRVDTRKWLLSKALPKVYGDKVALTGSEGGPVALEITKIERVIVKAPKGNTE